MPPFSVSAARNSPYPHPISTNQSKEIAMRTKITLSGEITGTIWMPAVEYCKEFHLELRRIPRESSIRTYPGIAPRSMEITCLRDALLHLTNDGDFQSCAVNWATLEVSHTFGDETRGTGTVKVRTRVREVRGHGENSDCFA
jgi:hypothetical protein